MPVKVTIEIEDELHEEARKLAMSLGLTVEELLRDTLRAQFERRSGLAAARDLLDLMDSHGGHSGGRRLQREDAYEERL